MNQAVAHLDRWMGALATIAISVAGLALIGMTAVEAWQVFARYVLNDSPGWTEPIALLFMNTAMMFGAAAAVRSEAHFGFFILLHSAPPPLRHVMAGIARLIAFATGGVLALWGGQLMLDGWDVPMAGAALPQGIAFLPLCLGGALIALFALERLVRAPLPAALTGEAAPQRELKPEPER